ncbi:MAG: 4a-hydroxytetrahydrobiopterin dehydratase [Candidatus Promineifilaceae bacterium]|jgi:4a-hydroxytetrahydrobiopterin dehydratase
MKKYRYKMVDNETLQMFLAEYRAWQVVESTYSEADDGIKRELYRAFKFGSYDQAFAFMSAVSKQVIVPLNHHPRWENDYNKLQVWFTTFDFGYQISNIDLEAAGEIERMWA